VTDVVRLLLRRGGPPLDALARIVASGSKGATIEVERPGGVAPPRWKTLLQASWQFTPSQRIAAKEEGLLEPFSSVAVNGNLFVCVDAHGTYSGIFQGNAPSSYRSEQFQQQFPVRFVDVEAVRRGGALEDAYSETQR